MGVCTHASNLYVLHASLLQLEPVGLPQVDVPLVALHGDTFHGKTSSKEGIVHFLTDLEGLQADAGPYHGPEVGGLCAQTGLDLRVFDDALKLKLAMMISDRLKAEQSGVFM